MTLQAFLLILRKQISQKWGRFLLASGGITVGIWAITLTSSLSFGLSDTIVTAINSQAAAREITIYKTPTNQTDFFQISEAPSFVPLSLNQLETIKNSNPDILEIVPRELIGFYQIKDGQSCIKERDKIAADNILAQASGTPPTEQELLQKQNDLNQKCPTINFTSTIFQYFYDSNRANWYGKTEKLAPGEIAVCYECGSLEFSKGFNVTKPEDLLGKEISLEYKQSPLAFDAGKTQSVLTFQSDTSITNSKIQTFKIVSVIDDRKANSFSIAGGNLNFYADFSHFEEALKLKFPDKDLKTIGFTENSAYINNYQNVDKVINNLKNDGYLPFSITQALISGVKTIFNILTTVLSGFGFIALIASVFGIINVMTISVLERKKEIGILKSLGARDRDIFGIFFVESSSLGFIGWLFGTLLAVGMGSLISLIFRILVDNNSEWKSNLEGLNISQFGPIFPFWLLLGTLGIAIVFTSISGLFPAIRASKQNPVDVLRSE